LFGAVLTTPGSPYADTDGTQERACDLSSVVSCSAVLDSPWAKLFGVPIAALGASWYLMLVWMAFILVSSTPVVPELVVLVLAWCGCGCLFVVYLLLVELHLGAICPMCTIIHVLTFVHTVCAARLLRRLMAEKPNLRLNDLVQATLLFARPWLVRMAVAFAVPVLFFVALNSAAPSDEVELALALAGGGGGGGGGGDSGAAAAVDVGGVLPKATLSYADNVKQLVACLEQKNVHFFGRLTCAHCRTQKELFAPVELPPTIYHECIVVVKANSTHRTTREDHADCKRLELHKFPSWLQFDSPGIGGKVIQQHSGVQKLVVLAKRYECGENKALEVTAAPVPESTDPVLSRNEQVQLVLKCLEHRNVRFFGESTCGFCKKQKELFLPFAPPPSVYFECLGLKSGADGVAKLGKKEECKRRKIENFPTWIQFAGHGINDDVIARHSGVTPLAELVARYDCVHAFDGGNQTSAPVVATNAVAPRQQHVDDQ